MKAVSKCSNFPIVIQVADLQEVFDADRAGLNVEVAHNKLCAFEGLSLGRVGVCDGTPHACAHCGLQQRQQAQQFASLHCSAASVTKTCTSKDVNQNLHKQRPAYLRI